MKFKVGRKYAWVSISDAPQALREYWHTNDISDHSFTVDAVNELGDAVTMWGNILVTKDHLKETVMPVVTKFKPGRKYRLMNISTLSPTSNIHKHWDYRAISDNTFVVDFVDEAGDAFARTAMCISMCVVAGDNQRQRYVVVEVLDEQ